ncbi:MAG: DUF3604 domain-containing protein [Pseudomonadaceae bacterium]|nr:DUF3604 domain-containing protein [Pseudomonadaceae bacterium]
MIAQRMICFALVLWCGAASASEQVQPGSMQLLWGDTHLHTNNSFDAFLNGNMSVTPNDAYRFAKGEPVIHAYNRARVQLHTPLDFLVVSDHAEFLGGIKDIYVDGIGIEDPGLIESLVVWYRERQIRDAIDNGEGQAFFGNLLPKPGDPRESARTWAEDLADPVPGADVSAKNAWHELLDTADAHNEPGQFTAFAGWEWSSQPGGANLHRIVLTDADAASGREIMPFASTDSPYPDDLWAWFAETEERTALRFLSIPHNPNVSKGMMFDVETLRGDAITADYAATRMRYEPVVEVTQIKGDSETHESLSPDDEFAEFETYKHYLSIEDEEYVVRSGDYVRSALKTGLAIGQDVGVNPFKLGMIGSTDSHTGLATAEEANFWGKFARDSVPENKSGSALGGADGWAMSAAGLAAVWARENTRASIMDAFARREVYATTGPRMRVRVFGGWSFSESDLSEIDTQGYRNGVPMGGELPARDGEQSPGFLIEAAQDPLGARLDRLQVVKGWVDETGSTHERVFEAAWSNDRDVVGGRLQPIADSVDRRTGEVASTEGASELSVLWRDPEFDPSRPAFYYVRVLQVPTARHSLLDQIALGLEPSDSYPEVIQERAYTSPIWYSPVN